VTCFVTPNNIGAGREAWVVVRRGRLGTVCARGADQAVVGDRSTSPLGHSDSSRWWLVTRTRLPHCTTVAAT